MKKTLDFFKIYSIMNIEQMFWLVYAKEGAKNGKQGNDDAKTGE